MKVAAVVLAVAVVAALPAVARSQGPPVARGGVFELRVMSFNIRYATAGDGENRWDNRKKLVFDTIARHRLDVVGLQEALASQVDEAHKTLPQYAVVGVGRDDGKRGGEFAPILYLASRFDVAEQGTFWLSDTLEVPGSKSWGNALPRVCTWARLVDRKTGWGLYVYNVHLDHASQPSRERSAQLLAERIGKRGSPDPVVVVGDFNAGEDNPVMVFLTQRPPDIDVGNAQPAVSPGLIDTFRALHPTAGQVGTYHGFNGAVDGDKIDYVLVQPEARVLEAAILRDNEQGRYPSDHYPVFARVRLVPVKK